MRHPADAQLRLAKKQLQDARHAAKGHHRPQYQHDAQRAHLLCVG